MKPLFDEKCMETARYFAPEGTTEETLVSFACAIQDAVENFMSDEENFPTTKVTS